MRKILIAEDEIAINKMLCMNLSLTGYETVSFYNGQEVMEYLENGGTADLALLDVMMPKMDGFALMEPMAKYHIPVIFLTARGDLESKIHGLTSGAEDYIVKPFEMLELLVRIDKVLKRSEEKINQIRMENIVINLDARFVTRDDSPISLTPMEYDLLLLLAKNKNIALKREKLLAEIWGIDFQGETRTVDVHIAQLRKKTGLSIVSVPKVGYRLEVIVQ